MTCFPFIAIKFINSNAVRIEGRCCCKIIRVLIKPSWHSFSVHKNGKQDARNYYINQSFHNCGGLGLNNCQLTYYCFIPVWVSVAFSAGGIRNRRELIPNTNFLLCVESGI